MNWKQSLLLEKRLISVPRLQVEKDEKRRAYLNSFLLVNFGIELENPEYINDEVLSVIDDLLRLQVPKSFYESPQDTKYFTCEELLLEQLIGYYLGYGTSLKRVELFQKVLPRKAVVGDEIKLRTYRIIDEAEADVVLRDAAKSYASYKRPFSVEETSLFLHLVTEKYFDPETDILCRDNYFPILDIYPELARKLDKKDLVKFSVDSFGEPADFTSNEHASKILTAALDLVQDCPLSKRQAKYYNKICKVFKGKRGKEDNLDSPYRALKRFIKADEPVEAAKYLSKHGSLLERNLKYILSRATTTGQVNEILSLIDDKNPALLIQLRSTLLDDDGSARTFSYYAKHRTHVYTESEMEVAHRKSRIVPYIGRMVHERLFEKVQSYYRSLPSLGKIYISPQFKKVAVPLNTTASGRGVDVLPQGSRIPFQGRYLRIFCRWQGVRDIDASLAVLKDPALKDKGPFPLSETLSWRTYHRKPFGDAALCSGDDTSDDGVEYQDIDVDALAKKCMVYAIAAINGYGGLFNQGQIVQGVQIKDKIDTAPWDPKNIEFQMNVVGDARAFVGFAVDLRKKEIVIINSVSTGGMVMDADQVDLCRRYLSPSYLGISMHDILACRGEIVEKLEDANIVFDAEYQAQGEQKVVRPFDVAELISLVNEKRS